MSINYQLSRFYRAYAKADQIAPSTLPEVVFAGRSNVGKSTLLNALLGNKNLAKTSSKPGKTATINFFEVPGCYYVDLPGYGYAQVSKSERENWAKLINGYFEQDRRLALVVSLVDIRHPANKLDVQMERFLMDHGFPFAVVLTKADKIGKQVRQRQVGVLREGLGLPETTPMLITSATDKTGIREVRSMIEKAVREA
ncbi:MAG: ribosome biogenesis GTP-binding protein YihA/YsxC [Coriobacteriales bacterium]|jgi:GTP-binding protein